MQTRSMMMTAALLAWAAIGCDGQSGDAPSTDKPHSRTVAEVDLEEGRKLAILETGEGAFGYVQSGPAGAKPVALPSDLRDHGDPIRVFRALAPNKEVPQTLTEAVNRTLLKLKNDASSPSKAQLVRSQAGGEPAVFASSADDGPIVQALNSSRDTAQTGGTGFAGCPEWWFNQASVNGNLLCPNSASESTCRKWVNWSYMYKNSANNSYGDVCVDSGTAIFQASYGSIVDTWWVPAGSWQFVKYYPYRSCGWFTCSDVRVFQKFEMLNNGALGHFGADMN